jgi:hypothetical protein
MNYEINFIMYISYDRISDKILFKMISVIKVETDGGKEYFLLSKEQNSVENAFYGLHSINASVKLIAEKSEEWSKAKTPSSEQVMQNFFVYVGGRGGGSQFPNKNSLPCFWILQAGQSHLRDLSTWNNSSLVMPKICCPLISIYLDQRMEKNCGHL